MEKKFFVDTVFDGVSGNTIILDIDGTLVADARGEMSTEVKEKVAHLAQFNIVYLFSNRSDRARNEAIAKELNLPFIKTEHIKPNKKVLEGVDEKDLINPLIVIGDKFLTDGLFARAVGARFIKVARIESEEDRMFAKFAYFLDSIFGIFWSHFK